MMNIKTLGFLNDSDILSYVLSCQVWKGPVFYPMAFFSNVHFPSLIIFYHIIGGTAICILC